MRKLTTATITLLVALSLTLVAGATDISLPVVKSAPPTTSNARPGHTDLWLATVELAQHCVVWDELMDCAEFPYSASLTPDDCNLAASMALDICITVGAPIESYGLVSIPYPTGFLPEGE